MNNPIFADAPTPFAPAPVRVSKSLQTFTVTLYADEPQELNILAMSSCDALHRAMALFFDDDGIVPPEGLMLCVRPLSVPRRHPGELAHA
jgi:hypothetical protein